MTATSLTNETTDEVHAVIAVCVCGTLFQLRDGFIFKGALSQYTCGVQNISIILHTSSCLEKFPGS